MSGVNGPVYVAVAKHRERGEDWFEVRPRHDGDVIATEADIVELVSPSNTPSTSSSAVSSRRSSSSAVSPWTFHDARVNFTQAAPEFVRSFLQHASNEWLAAVSVCDGHGGPKCAKFVASALCEELDRACDGNITSDDSDTDGDTGNHEDFNDQFEDEENLDDDEMLDDEEEMFDDDDDGDAAHSMRGVDSNVATPLGPSDRLHARILRAHQQTEQKWHEHAQSEAYEHGTTAVAAMIGRTRLVVANVGDSRAVLCRGGSVHELTTEHKAMYADESMRIINRGGFVRGGLTSGEIEVSRAFGNLRFGQDDDYIASRLRRPQRRGHKRVGLSSRPDVVSVPRSTDDEFVVFGTDGLFDYVSPEECCQVVRHALGGHHGLGSLARNRLLHAARALVRRAVSAPQFPESPDDVTAAVVLLDNELFVPRELSSWQRRRLLAQQQQKSSPSPSVTSANSP